MVLAFDSDQKHGGQGFRLSYEIVGIPTNEISDTIEEAKEGIQNVADYYIDIEGRPNKAARVKRKLETLFSKFTAQMERCGVMDKESITPNDNSQ